MEQDKLSSVFTFYDLAEGEVIKNLLESEGIRILIRSFEDSAYDGIYTLTQGKGKIFVLERDKNRAEQLIKEYFRDNPPGK